MKHFDSVLLKRGLTNDRIIVAVRDEAYTLGLLEFGEYIRTRLRAGEQNDGIVVARGGVGSVALANL